MKLLFIGPGNGSIQSLCPVCPKVYFMFFSYVLTERSCVLGKIAEVREMEAEDQNISFVLR